MGIASAFWEVQPRTMTIMTFYVCTFEMLSLQQDVFGANGERLAAVWWQLLPHLPSLTEASLYMLQ